MNPTMVVPDRVAQINAQIASQGHTDYSVAPSASATTVPENPSPKENLYDDKGNVTAVYNTNLGDYRDVSTGARYVPPSTTSSSTKSSEQSRYDTAQSNIDRITKESDDAYNTFKNTADAYANGTIPLTPDQQAQIQGIQQQYQTLINNQNLIGIGATGNAAIRGYQKGAAEYDPTFNQKVIGSIFSAGQEKVAKLNNDMASAVASLTSAFKSENYRAVKEAYDVFREREKEQKSVFQKTIEDSQKAIEKAQERQREVENDATISDFIAKGVTSPQEILAEMKKLKSDITAKEIADTVTNLIKTQSYPGGVIGEYQFYVDNEKAAGRTPVDFNAYQNLDANRKAAVARAGVGATGLDSSTLAKVQSVANAFDSQQIVKDYNTISGKYQTVKKIIDSGVGGPGDLAIVYEFMKGVDPTSVVRETEYASAAKSGNIFKGIYAKYNGYLKEEGGFLPDQVKEDFLSILNTKLGVADQQYKNLFNEYGRRINNLTGGKDGTDYLTNYANSFPTEDGKMEDFDTVYLNNPDLQDKIDQMILNGEPKGDILIWINQQ